MRRIQQITVVGIAGIPRVRPGNNIAKLIAEAATRQGTGVEEGDIMVVSQKIVSKSEGRVVNLRQVKPSPFALSLATSLRKDPSLVELALRESKSIIRMGHGNLITETRHGWICANAGVDRSNVSGGARATLLPLDSDRSARKLRRRIRLLTGKNVAVIIADTFGRPHREGVVNMAIGLAGLEPILDLRGKKDLFGYTLVVKQIAVADELAAAAELAMGNADEGLPAAIIRGFRRCEPSETASAKPLIRRHAKDLFR